MKGEVLETTQPTNWKTKVKEMAPVAASLLIISVTYLLAGVTQRDGTSLAVGVFAGAAFIFLPAITFFVGRLRASGFHVLKSWFILVPVLGWLVGKFLLSPWIKAIF